MAQTKRFSIQAYDNTHYRRTQEYVRSVNSLIDAATKTIAESAAKAGVDPDKPFEYKDYPKVRDAMRDATKRLASRLTATIESGSEEEWLFACEKNDKFLESIMDTSKLAKGQLESYQDRNLDALREFQQRKVDGLDLSQRVWKYVGQYREQMETALDAGLGEGRSAQQLARDIKENLNDPDRLFRRVRDKRGNLVLSKSAKAFHPGTGVYRSSVRNAQRLARSEINMAYRESDWRRWQSEDFVVGIEVKRSNHTPQCKCPVCAKLVGQYPKAFKFIGWHPQCLCYAIPVLESDDETMEGIGGRLRAALHGEEYRKYPSKNTVADVPEGFKKWVNDNISAQDNWKSTPYFIRDNFVNGRLADGLNFQTGTIVPEMEVTALGSNVPDWKFAISKKGNRERLIQVVDNLEHYYGKNSSYQIAIDNARDALKRGIDDLQASYYLRNVFSNAIKDMNGVLRPNYDCINHLQELRKTDGSSIPQRWRPAYNAIIRELNTYDFNNGYKDVFNKIEGAYNIYKLSSNATVMKMGFDKVSIKTPYNFFTEYVKAYPDWELPPKAFFNALVEFVPLVNRNEGNMPACYYPTAKYVQIDLKDKYFAERLSSAVARKMVIPHEFGHAFDHQKSLTSDSDLKSVFNKWKYEIDKDKGASLESAICKELDDYEKDYNDRIKVLHQQYLDFRMRGKINEAEKAAQECRKLLVDYTGFCEKLIKMADSLQAALDDHRRIRPGGHSVGYYASSENQLSEFFAHCCENYWVGNDIFKKLDPKIYKKMCDLVKNKMR